jgi:hypothetical protein
MRPGCARPPHAGGAAAVRRGRRQELLLAETSRTRQRRCDAVLSATAAAVGQAGGGGWPVRAAAGTGLAVVLAAGSPEQPRRPLVSGTVGQPAPREQSTVSHALPATTAPDLTVLSGRRTPAAPPP